MHKPRKRELSILLTAHCLDKIHILWKLWPLNSILPRTDNSTVTNQGASFIPHGLDEISFRDLNLKLHKSIPSGCRVMALHS